MISLLAAARGITEEILITWTFADTQRNKKITQIPISTTANLFFFFWLINQIRAAPDA